MLPGGRNPTAPLSRIRFVSMGVMGGLGADVRLDHADEVARSGRLRTLLPIFRNDYEHGKGRCLGR